MAPLEESAERGWGSAWPDATAFLLGLGAAWFLGWNTTDLVWSLWLSSLVVGYAVLVWSITRPLRELVVGMSTATDRIPLGGGIAGVTLLMGGSLFMLAFFTVHFGGFHFVHSMFLRLFFPIDGAGQKVDDLPTFASYGEVVLRYWWFLPAAFMAERVAFQTPAVQPADTSVTAEAIAKRKASKGSDPLTAPYRNVIRMHLLIFFFAFASFAKLDNFLVYTGVYAVYFFPWRLVKGKTAGAQQV